MSQHELIAAKKKIAVARLVMRERRPPLPKLSVRLRPQHLRWEVGRYLDRIRSGPGGLGRAKIWAPERVGEQHNLVLDNAYELIAQYGFGNLHRYMAVGTGSTAPSPGDTALASELVRSNRVPSGFGISYASPSDGVYDVEMQIEFLESEVGGQNLTEWGAAPTATSTLAARELFRDSGGNPITLTIASDQRLRLIYTMRTTISPVTAQPVSLAITNLGTLTGKLIARKNDDFGLIHSWATGAAAGVNFGSQFLYMGVQGGAVGLNYTDSDPTYYAEKYNFAGAIEPYAAGSRVRRFTPTWTTAQFNRTIGSIGLGYGDYGSWAGLWLVFDAGSELTKDNLHKLIWDSWTLSW